VRVAFKDASTIRARNDYYAFGKQTVNSLLPAGNDATNRWLYNGKEKLTTGNVGFLDYGAKMYDSEIARQTTMDELAEVDFQTSPFAYARNTPANAIDLEGKLTVFVNGFHPSGYASYALGMSQGNNSRSAQTYNSQVDRSFQNSDTYGWGGLDTFYKDTYDDANALYVNASYAPLGPASARYNGGIVKGNELIAMLDSGEISLTEGEKIRLVGYSQGAAYAAGMASALASSQYAHLLDFVDYLAPHQPEGFAHPYGVPGRQFGSTKDGSPLGAGKKRIKNVQNHYLGTFGNMTDLRGHLLGDDDEEDEDDRYFDLNTFIMRAIAAGATVTVQ
jgi:RHS repeat-associated protein